MRRLVTACAATLCAGCVAAESLSVATLRAEMARVERNRPYKHDLAADLAWIDAMPVIERLAADIINFEARFIAVGRGRWSVPGVPPRLYCLIGPASMRPIPIGQAAETETERALAARVDSFVVPYNRLLAEYYEAEYGWDCEDAPAGDQSIP